MALDKDWKSREAAKGASETIAEVTRWMILGQTRIKVKL